MTQANPLIFAHVGYATKSIEKELSHFYSLGFTDASDFFIDTAQQMRAKIVQNSGTQVELVEPLDDTSHLHTILKKKINMYHMAFYTAQFDSEIERLSGEGILIKEATFSKFFNGRIAFILLQNRLMVEIIEQTEIAQGI